MRFIERLKLDEGFESKPYLDSVGVKTIGYGRNLEAEPLTEEEGEYLLLNSLKKVENNVITLTYWETLSTQRKNVIRNMVYNLGFAGFLKFKNVQKALTNKNYELAAKEMLDSKWAKQVKGRALRLAMQMKGD